MELQDKPMENDGEEQSTAQPLESASSASASLQSVAPDEEVEIHPVHPHVGQETDNDKEDEETDMEADDGKSNTSDDVEDSDTDDDESADESDTDDEPEPRDSGNQPQPAPRALEPMQLESFLETWPRKKVPRSTLKRAADEVTEQWGEIKRAYLPREPVGSLADDAEERRVLGRLIVERTHVRMVRSDDGEDVPRVYLPGSSVPVTPVESLLKPLRRLLKAASVAQAPDHRAGAQGDEEQLSYDTLQAIESLLDVIRGKLHTLQRKVRQVRAQIGAQIVRTPANAG